MPSRTVEVASGLTAVLVCAELLLRLAGPGLPDPAPWPTPETRVKSAQMAEFECVELVFLGTSVTEAAVVPGIIGDAYNAALPFSTQRSMRYWAERFVVPALCPDTVVIGVPAWSPEFALPTVPDPLLRGLDDVVTFQTSQTWLDGAIDTPELITRRAQLKSLSELWTELYRPERSGLIDPRGRQTGYDGRLVEELPDENAEIVGEAVDLSAMRRLIQVLRDSGIQVALVVEPSRCGPSGECPMAQLRDSLVARYRDIASEFGVPFVDLWDRFEPSEYADPAHLNELGAARFTNELAAALAQLGLLP